MGRLGRAHAAGYEYWSGKVCGLACLKMIMGWRGLPIPATMHLVERALAWQAYVPDGDRVAGLIYRPFARWVGDDYGIAAEVVPVLPLRLLAGLASPGTPVIASVHKWLRWPDRVPPERGGHLVLVTGAADGLVRLHNPSGMPGASQRDALVEVADFARFFAERGLITSAAQLASIRGRAGIIRELDHPAAELAGGERFGSTAVRRPP